MASKWSWLIPLIIAIIIMSTRIAMSRVPTPGNLGVRHGTLAPCPGSPNCVSSIADAGTKEAIAPIPYDGDTASAQATMVDIVSGLPRTTIVTDEPGYIHAVSRSFTMAFPDDTEFYFDETNRLIHVRAAARVGEGDFNVNRKRVETVRAAFSARAR